MARYNPETHMLAIYRDSSHIEFTLTQTRALGFADDSSRRRALSIINSMDSLADRPIHADIKTILHKRGGGGRLHLQMHFIPVHDGQGQLKEYFGMCRDISDLKNIEEKLAAETLRAQEVEVLKNAFLHNMSFEIRTPLNTVVGFAELFQMEHSQEDEMVFIQEIKNNSSKLLKLINDILFLSRLDAEMIEFKTHSTDFTSMINQQCEAVWGNSAKAGVDYIVSSPFRRLVLDIDSTNVGIIIDKIVTKAQSLSFGKDGRLAANDVTLTLIPYYAWCHRGSGEMTVWLPRELRAFVDDDTRLLARLEGQDLILEAVPGFLLDRLKRPEVREVFSVAAKEVLQTPVAVRLTERKQDQREKRDLNELRQFKEVTFK